MILYAIKYYLSIYRSRKMSSAAAPPTSDDASLQQQSKQRKNLVSKILKRSCSLQAPSMDPKQSLNTGKPVASNTKNDTKPTKPPVEPGRLYVK